MVSIYLLGAGGIFILLLIVLQRRQQWKGNPPPGPPSYPFVGSLFALINNDPAPHIAYNNLVKKYGPIVRLILGGRRYVVVGGYEELKQLTNHDKIEDRPHDLPFIKVTNMITAGQERGMGLFSGELVPWRALRRFSLRTLRDLGLGKSASEENILEESKHMVIKLTELAKNNGQKFDPEFLFNCASLNVIWYLVAKQRFDYDDKRINNLLHIQQNFMSFGEHVVGKPLGVYPFLKNIPPYKSVYQHLLKEVSKSRQFIRETIEEHKKHLDPNNPEDYIDSFLVKLQKTDQPDIFNVEQLLMVCFNFFTAGADTANKTLMWAIGYLVHHPDVQEKIYSEMVSVMNNQDMIKFSDKEKLPYTEATLYEVWRMGNVGAIAPLRCATSDVKFNGYDIPKDSVVFFTTYGVHMDPEYWGDPEVFRPERFIQPDGSCSPGERMVPFGMGRRKCLGEALATMESFIFLANMLYHFRFYCPQDELPSMIPQPGFTFGPEAYNVCITPRN